MRYNNRTIRAHHQALFAPLVWLERLEEQQHNGDDRHRPGSPLPTPLNATLIGLKTTLLRLQQGFRFEQQQLSELFEHAGKASLLDSLKPYRQRISAQTRQLLDVLAAIHSLANSAPSHRDQPVHIEDCWDETAALVAELSDQLIRYLHLSETRYLPLADYLLRPVSNTTSNGRNAPHRATASVSIGMLALASQPSSAQYHSS
ncbi:MAG: hypothetical protein V7629_19320 [Motiliproteus sp.]